MSREIKFRFILQHCDTKEKKVTIPYSLDMISTNTAENDIYASESTDYIIIGEEQFTGLKDKNGVEIYEGDILRNPKARKTNFFVKYDLGIYNAVYYNNFTLALYPVLNEFEGCEIIGNIHANPDLI